MPKGPGTYGSKVGRPPVKKATPRAKGAPSASAFKKKKK